MKAAKKIQIALVLVGVLLLATTGAALAGAYLQGTGTSVTPEVLAGIAGAVLSLLAAFIPGFNTWYAGQRKEIQQLIMLGLTILSGAGIFGMSCAGVLREMFGYTVACTQTGVIELVWMVVITIMASQGIYGLVSGLRPNDVKEISAERKAAVLLSEINRPKSTDPR